MTRSSVRIRESMPAERPAVMTILDGALLETDAVDERIDAGDVLVAVDDDRLLGALVLDSRRDGAHVEAIAVRRRRRGQGIGTQLVRAAEARANRLTAEFEPGVRPFYESLGFAITPIGDGRLRGVREPP